MYLSKKVASSWVHPQGLTAKKPENDGFPSSVHLLFPKADFQVDQLLNFRG